MKQIILLNGPPRCGKNTIANAIPYHAIIGFSHHLKRCVHAMHFGAAGWAMDPDAFDAVKSEPLAMLGGRSWRQEYIRFSEEFVKPVYGNDWFGEQFVKAAMAAPELRVIVPDSGFREEAERTVCEFGPENVTLIRIHRDGATFAGDSRSYIDLADLGVACFDIDNNSTVDAAAMAARTLTRGWGFTGEQTPVADALG